ncbi:CAMK/CAMKL/KIN1 protein kinase [Allomyces macrogynus ATCC 38327]|uniref:CAMK/CAMKL/KIN1 protein kinase n=1 Tax=Allomyces macrogynus (strain ATCC 38327) TaxID=578462 RepID=A0A0L0SQQ0_ALLM3|nr:CAMK/CAMKL/KIN1 protein kinase [Allomyces macrogynus ATCC 38327]|eukprot:KNE64685.1 CAMK/CAMKL/KIN1 protein kinase [Allomyces macrogynus ATCC 38327]
MAAAAATTANAHHARLATSSTTSSRTVTPGMAPPAPAPAPAAARPDEEAAAHALVASTRIDVPAPFFRAAAAAIVPRSPRTPAAADGRAATARPPAALMVDKYRIGRTIGEGSIGKVKLAMDDTGQKYAVKIIDRSKIANVPGAEARIVREAAVLSLLDHPHIVRMVDAIATPTHFFLVMEHVPGGQVLDLIVANGALPLHLNIATTTTLRTATSRSRTCCSTPKGDLKVIDFGLCNFFDRNTLLQTFCGSVYFASPELLSAQPYAGAATDVWSAACILFVMAYGRVPFDAPSLPALHAKIKAADVAFPVPESPSAQALQDLLRNMLVADPVLRWSIEHVKAHPWLAAAVPVICAPPAVPDRSLKKIALMALFTPGLDHTWAHQMLAHGAHDRAIDLVQAVAQGQTRDEVVAGIRDPTHHFHALYWLCLEWLERRGGGCSGTAPAPVPTAELTDLLASMKLAGGPFTDSGLGASTTALAAEDVTTHPDVSDHSDPPSLHAVVADAIAATDRLHDAPPRARNGGPPYRTEPTPPAIAAAATAEHARFASSSSTASSPPGTSTAVFESLHTPGSTAPLTPSMSLPRRSPSHPQLSSSSPFSATTLPRTLAHAASSGTLSSSITSLDSVRSRPAPLRIPPGMNTKMRGPPPSPSRAGRTHWPTNGTIATASAIPPPLPPHALTPVPELPPPPPPPVADPVPPLRRARSLRTLLAGATSIAVDTSDRTPVGSLCAIAADRLHLRVSDADETGATLAHAPSVVGADKREVVMRVKLAKGLLGPALVFKLKHGEVGVFRMLVEAMQREWARVKASGGVENEGSMGDSGARGLARSQSVQSIRSVRARP